MIYTKFTFLYWLVKLLGNCLIPFFQRSCSPSLGEHGWDYHFVFSVWEVAPCNNLIPFSQRKLSPISWGIGWGLSFCLRLGKLSFVLRTFSLKKLFDSFFFIHFIHERKFFLKKRSKSKPLVEREDSNH